MASPSSDPAFPSFSKVRPSNVATQSCVHELIEAVARRSPSAVAVLCGEESLTYGELEARSNDLAQVLRAKGIGPEALVGLCVERSIDMVVGLLGILKAGGAYVPLDPSYPLERIRYILEDARVRILVTQENVRARLPDPGIEVQLLDSRSPLPSVVPLKGTPPGPRNLAYVIYTSGSTGRPKGVQIEHRNLVNFLLSMQQEPGLGPQDVLLAVTTLSFDIAGLEIYLPLIAGARVVIASREAAQDGRKLAALLNHAGATVMQATPATWRLLIESGWEGKRDLRVLCGGEALSAELARELVKRAGSVWNLYGPTETTIWSSLYRVRGNEERSVPIGRPIANTSLYVLSERREPLPAGQEGELYIGGAGVARGYFERPELTAEKFVPDPFSPDGDLRLYRTGDLARCRPHGEVEFLGRLDHQVKVRGFRIELGEIEAVLEQHSGVKQAVVVAREDQPGNKFLAAYVVLAPEERPAISDLRKYLEQHLPEYMVPAAFVELPAFPMTPNGKVDRKVLPAPTAADFTGAGTYVAARDKTERRLVSLWESVLGIRPIGVNTSFFDLGGRSVLAARLFMKISREFGEDIPLSALFESPTIEQLANRLRKRAKDFSYRTVVEIQTAVSRPPFFCVHGGTGGTLFLHRLARAMGPDQPFYAFQPEGVDGRRIGRTSIEAMAGHYLDEMRKVQPSGPYFIGGYCFGGIVAFEMAQQLWKQGISANLVAMFSAPLRFNRPPGERPFIAERTPKPASSPGRRTFLGRIQGAVRWRAENMLYAGWGMVHKHGCRWMVAAGIPVPQKWRELYIARALLQAEKRYSPQFLDGRLVIFRGAGIYDHDPGMGWSKLARQVEDHVIGAPSQQKTRRDIMNEPLVETVAVLLKGYMDAALKREPAAARSEQKKGPGKTAISRSPDAA